MMGPEDKKTGLWTDDVNLVHAAEIECLFNISTNRWNFAEFSLSLSLSLRLLLMCLLSFRLPNVQVNISSAS
jgi:hypothetical protein